MTKALNITNVLAVFIAAVAVSVAVFLGSKPDKQSSEFLAKAGAIELFKSSNSQKAPEGQETISPLVKQAQDFALYLNPPPKQPVASTTSPEMAAIPRPKVESVKFNLIATSYFQADPELSLALVDEPGKGLMWVRQSSSVGRFLIDEIRDGSIIAKDGERTIEIIAQRESHKSLLRNKNLTPQGDSGVAPVKLPSVSKSEVSARPEILRPNLAAKGLDPAMPTDINALDLSPYINAEENKLLEEHIKLMGSLDMNDEANLKKGEELIEQFMKQMTSQSVSDAEAAKLDTLGEKLNDPNSVLKSSETTEEELKKEAALKRIAERRTKRGNAKVQ